MSSLTIQNIRSPNETEPLILRTGNTYVLMQPANSTTNFAVTGNVILEMSQSLVESIWIPNHAFRSFNTYVSIIETSNNKIQYPIFPMEPANSTTAFTEVKLPSTWNRGNIDWSVITSQKFSGTGNVVYNLVGFMVNEGNNTDLPIGHISKIKIPMGTENTLYMSNNSHYFENTSGLIVSNISAGPLVQTLYLRLSREASSSNDTLTVDTCIHGLELRFGLERTEVF